MRPVLLQIGSAHTPESLVEQLLGEPGIVLLRSALFESPQARYSLVAPRPFLTFRSFGSRCEIFFTDAHHAPAATGRRRSVPHITHVSRRSQTKADHVQFGDPWRVLDGLMSRYELLDEVDLPFPLGGCFGY